MLISKCQNKIALSTKMGDAIDIVVVATPEVEYNFCTGCYFQPAGNCNAAVPCEGGYRDDNRSVIFVKEI